MAQRISISNFDFKFNGYGSCKVRYTTGRGDYWQATIEDMTLIDHTRNENEPTQKALRELADAVKRNGIHYGKNGSEIYDC